MSNYVYIYLYLCLYLDIPTYIETGDPPELRRYRVIVVCVDGDSRTEDLR